MATVTQTWEMPAGVLRSTAFPGLSMVVGTNIPARGYAFDAATEEAIFLPFRAVKYGSGNLTVDLDWYSDTATSGVVQWGAQIAAITPDTDSQDVETDTLATIATVNDTHLGTVGQRLHRATITITALDSLANDDDVQLRVARIAANAADTMAGDAILKRVAVSYSDT